MNAVCELQHAVIAGAIEATYMKSHMLPAVICDASLYYFAIFCFQLSVAIELFKDGELG